MDAVRDAVAAVKACARDDSEGLHAILTGTDDPRGALGMLAAITWGILARCEFPNDGPGAWEMLLDDIARRASDGVLDLMPRSGTRTAGGG